MTQWVLLVSLLALLALAMNSLVIIIPRTKRSQARDRLWQLRDELFDACLEEELPGNHPNVTHLRNVVDFTLEHEDVFRLSTFVAFFATNRLSKGALTQLIARTPAPPRDTLSGKQRRRIEEFDNRFTSALVDLVVFGSPGGIFVTLWLAPLGALLSLRNRNMHGGDGAGTRIFGPELRPYTEQLAGFGDRQLPTHT